MVNYDNRVPDINPTNNVIDVQLTVRDLTPQPQPGTQPETLSPQPEEKSDENVSEEPTPKAESNIPVSGTYYTAPEHWNVRYSGGYEYTVPNPVGYIEFESAEEFFRVTLKLDLKDSKVFHRRGLDLPLPESEHPLALCLGVGMNDVYPKDKRQIVQSPFCVLWQEGKDNSVVLSGNAREEYRRKFDRLEGGVTVVVLSAGKE